LPAAKKQGTKEDVVFLAIRVPKSMKRDLQQVALNEESTVQALVREAIQAELARRSPTATRAKRR
jgi:predicted transcriptional regulator